MKLIILATAILISTLGFSQANNSQSVLQQIEKGETNKVLLDVSTYNENTIIDLKQSLTDLKKEITLVDYNESQKIITFIYNEYLIPEKIISIFDKHGVSHTNSTSKLYKN